MWGQWHQGNLWDVRVWTDGRDTYPLHFSCKVQVMNTKTGEIKEVKGRGEFIGNFSPIWITWQKKKIQLTELLRLEEVANVQS